MHHRPFKFVDDSSVATAATALYPDRNHDLDPLIPKQNMSAARASFDSGGDSIAGNPAPALAPIGPSPARFAVLFVFCVSTGVSAFMWLQFAPIQPLITDLFGMSAGAVNLLAMTYYAFYLPASLFSVWMMERHGLLATLAVAGATQLICACVKLAGAWNDGALGYGLLMVGQVLAALAQPLILNVVPRISSDWFPEQERNLATAVMTQSNVIGQLVAVLLVPAIVNDAGGLRLMSACLILPCGLALGLTLYFVRDRPATAPSASAAHQWAEQDAEAALSDDVRLSALSRVWRDAKLLAHNFNFNLLNASFSIATGIGWTLLTVQAQLLTPCGYDATRVGNISSALLGLGILTSLGAAPLLERTHAYRAAQVVVMAGCALSAVLVVAANRPDNFAFAFFAWLCMGAFIQPLIPVSLEHAAELTFPITADSSATVLLTCGNLVGLALTFAIGPLLDLPPSAQCSSVINWASGFIVGFMMLGLLLVLPLRADNRRIAAEKAAAVVAAGAGVASTADSSTTASISAGPVANRVKGDRGQVQPL